MQTSVYLAKLIGPFFLIVGLAILINVDAFRAVVKEFLNSPGQIFFSGMLTLPVGIAILLAHNVWAPNWRVLITLIGWLAALTSIVRIVAPQRVAGVAKTVASHPFFPIGPAAIWVAIGAVLCFYGYVR
jgi:hypothetical protein